MSSQWQPYRESPGVTLARTVAIAVVLGGLLAGWSGGGLARWPLATVLALWPSLGGHFVELWYVNWLRPRLSRSRLVQMGARVVVWFVGGSALMAGMGVTATALGARWPRWGHVWWAGGVGFIALELLVHLVLHLRGRPSFYDGRG